MTTLVAVDPEPRDPQRWPSSVKTSTLLLALEALARWREQLALTIEDPQKYVELSNLTEDWRTGPH